MRIGVVVATEREKEAFSKVFSDRPYMHTRAGNHLVDCWKLSLDREVFLVLSGVGEIAAAISTQYLIDVFHVDVMINYGVVGGLINYEPKKPFLVNGVVHYDFDMTFDTDLKVGQYPNTYKTVIEIKRNAFFAGQLENLDKLICASGDKIVPGGEPKKRLRREFGADVCDMESAGFVITCNRNRMPCAIIKAISDGVDEDVEAFEKNVDEAALNCAKLIFRLASNH